MAGKSKSWTAERRAKHAQWMKDNKPWLKSTGPKTDAGKEMAKMNALKHGLRGADYREVLRLLKQQAAFIKSLNCDRLPP